MTHCALNLVLHDKILKLNLALTWVQSFIEEIESLVLMNLWQRP